VEITGADNRVRTSEAVEVRVIDPESLTIINAKDSEGGAYGIGEPFQYKVMANSGGNAYDITKQVKPSDLNYNFGSAGTSISVSIAAASSFSGISWSPVTVDVKTLEDRVAWANGSGGSHTLLVYDDETMPGVTTANIDNAEITLKSSDETLERTLQLSTTGRLFHISGSGAKLILDRNITLNGIPFNGTALVRVESSGELVMEADSLITGNNGASGGGVFVGGNGTLFTMNSGAISNNDANYGGGVYVDTNGTFTMSGSASISTNIGSVSGGGVYISGGTFNMNGGTIGGTSTEKNTSLQGAGVYMNGGTFNMNGSTSISNNEATTFGGGVYVETGTFTLTQGTVYGTDDLARQNTAGGYGDALYVFSGGTATDGLSPLGSIVDTTIIR
jgi:predicted outer membrane repeat protein